MKILKSLKELEGKTIKSADIIHVDEYLCLKMTDDSYVVFDAEISGSMAEMVINTSPDDVVLRAAGIISEEELTSRQRARKAEIDHNRKARELKELLRLKAKYEG